MSYRKGKKENETMSYFLDEDRFNMYFERANRLEEEIKSLRKEKDKYKIALEIIAGHRSCVDNLMSNVEVAKAALKEK